MRISINSPSYGRARMLDTFRYLPSISYWVHEFEVGAYREANPGIRIEVLPDETRGNIARVRNFILQNQLPQADAVLMIDDDVNHIAYWERNRRRKLESEAEVLEMIERYTRLAQEWGVKLWGINVNQDKQIYREYTPFSLTSYISASFSCFLAGNDLFYDERFPLKEDYDMTLQQLNRYRRVLRVNKFYYFKKGAEQTGGCAGYRNVAREMAQIEALQAKWGRRIVRFDRNQRSHTSKKRRAFDINPVIHAPIPGV